jgi:chromosome segregation ATPase
MTLEIPMNYGEYVSNGVVIRDLEGRHYMDSPLVEMLVRRLIDADEARATAEKSIDDMEGEAWALVDELKDDLASRDEEINQLCRDCNRLEDEKYDLEERIGELEHELRALEAADERISQ